MTRIIAQQTAELDHVNIFNIANFLRIYGNSSKAIELLSYFFAEDMREVLGEIREMNMLAQADIFDLWFEIIKSRDYLESLAKTIIYYSIGMPV
ncbi:hypothetical protein [Enterobacter kobei]|uniref:hypothetical protein n=1 Tax=Enterobacter kobei TaxID=208224 RepID=UPI002455DDE0|nr:hypothetical protein [Enterobacter kobei]